MAAARKGERGKAIRKAVTRHEAGASAGRCRKANGVHTAGEAMMKARSNTGTVGVPRKCERGHAGLTRIITSGATSS